MPQVVLNLPDELLERASIRAAAAGQSLEGYLVERLACRSADGAPEGSPRTEWDLIDLSGISDEQLLMFIEAGFPRDMQERLSQLQARAAEGAWTAGEAEELGQLARQARTMTFLKERASVAWKGRHGELPGRRTEAPG
jgi:hypothetical protein